MLVAKKLTRLQALKQQGLLTEDEFNANKASLLGSGSDESKM